MSGGADLELVIDFLRSRSRSFTPQLQKPLQALIVDMASYLSLSLLRHASLSQDITPTLTQHASPSRSAAIRG